MPGMRIKPTILTVWLIDKDDIDHFADSIGINIQIRVPTSVILNSVLVIRDCLITFFEYLNQVRIVVARSSVFKRFTALISLFSVHV